MSYFWQGLKIGLALLALLVLWKNQSIANYFNSHFFAKPSAPLLREVATVLEIKGHVTTPSALVENTEVEIGKESALRVQFFDGTELEFLSETRVVFDFWNRMMPNSPALVWMLNGDFNLIKAGSMDQVFMVHAGQIFTPSTKPKKWTPPVVVAVETEKTEAPAPLVVQPKSQSLSLTNEYMDDMIANQRQRLINCQQNTARAEGEANGLIVVGFRITNEGKVLEPRVIGATELDQGLQNCVLEVISEIRFKSFVGAEIVRSIEFNFE